MGEHRLRLVVREQRSPELAGASVWQRYERMKRHIADTASSAQEYQDRIAALADELGL